MSIADVPVEATNPSNRSASPGRSPKAMTALASRIRALQQSEPTAGGDERTDALAQLALLQLQLERLSLTACRNDANQKQMLADTFAIAEAVDLLARLWPPDAAPNAALAATHRHRTTSPGRKAA